MLFMHSKQKNTDFIQFLLQVGWAYATTIRKAYNVLCRLLRESSAAHFFFVLSICTHSNDCAMD